MLTIGELAAAAGTTTRAVRHYHAVGLLPEPERRANGYREYDARALLRLVRIRRLGQLGLSLAEVRRALAGDDERDLRELLVDLLGDLTRQEAALREQRQRLVALLERDRDLALPPDLAELLSEMRHLVPDEQLVAREAELLELLESTLPAERFAELAQHYRAALADPQHVARGVAAASRFEALAALDPDDPQVQAVAAELSAMGRESFRGLEQGAEAPDGQSGVWAAYQASLAPAQQRCLALVEAALSADTGDEGPGRRP